VEGAVSTRANREGADGSRKDLGRATAKDLNRIPEEMRMRPQWVGWSWEERNGEMTKVPYDPETGRRARVNDLLTWRPFEVALGALESGDYDGVGFVFCSGDPYVGIDLDDVRNPETGELESWAETVVRIFKGYAEVSPSGTGIHIIVRGKAPRNGRLGRVEVYHSERFFTMTGRAL
jgi:putative DNA primase/helicase